MEAIDTTTGYVMQQGSKEKQTVSLNFPDSAGKELVARFVQGGLPGFQFRRSMQGRGRTGGDVLCSKGGSETEALPWERGAS